MKRVTENLNKIDREKLYDTNEAIDLLIECQPVKFDQTIDIAINLLFIKLINMYIRLKNMLKSQ